MDSQSLAQIPGLSGSYGVDLRSQPPPGEMGGVLAELIAEKESLDPAYVHCARLLEAGTLKDPGVGIVLRPWTIQRTTWRPLRSAFLSCSIR